MEWGKVQFTIAITITIDYYRDFWLLSLPLSLSLKKSVSPCPELYNFRLRVVYLFSIKKNIFIGLYITGGEVSTSLDHLKLFCGRWKGSSRLLLSILFPTFLSNYRTWLSNYPTWALYYPNRNQVRHLESLVG